MTRYDSDNLNVCTLSSSTDWTIRFPGNISAGAVEQRVCRSYAISLLSQEPWI